MNQLSSLLSRSLATAVVTAAALGGNAMAATCAPKCAPLRARGPGRTRSPVMFASC